MKKDNDVTPEKLRQVQREKGLHGRSLDDPEFISNDEQGLEFSKPFFCIKFKYSGLN